MPQLEKACTQQRPTTAKNQYIKSFKKKKKEGQVRAADPEEGCLSGDGGEAMVLHFPSEQESALTQAGGSLGRRKSGTERAILQRSHTSHPSQPVRVVQAK